jgi:hypothetical protein
MAKLIYEIEVDLYETEYFEYEPDYIDLLKVLKPIALKEMKTGEFKVDHDDVHVWLEEYEDFILELYDEEIKAEFYRDAIDAFVEYYTDPYSIRGISRGDFY